MIRIPAITAAFLVLCHGIGWGTIINIPADYPTIQQGIDASLDGDTVLVQPGTYYENINFNGHNIVLGSMFLTTGDTSFIGQTVIDGEYIGSVVSFEDGEDLLSGIKGFTIRHGLSQFGGGIYCDGASPTISSNYIINNVANSEFDGFGGGICCRGYSSPVIAGNIIRNNNAFGGYYGEGGGISIQSQSRPVIENNLIYGNNCSGFYGGAGGGIGNFSESIIRNNTIANNDVYGQPGMMIGGLYSADRTALLTNNIIRCNFSADLVGTVAASFCNIEDTLWSGEGNIDIDPIFRDTLSGDYHLMSIACGDSADSPCIDAGDPNILDSLLDCSWGLGGARSDMGAYGGGDSLITGIAEYPIVPEEFVYMRSYPNPFNSKTEIEFETCEDLNLSLYIYNLLGQRIDEIFDGNISAGRHSFVWDAADFPSGVYFAKLISDKYSGGIKLSLLK